MYSLKCVSSQHYKDPAIDSPSTVPLDLDVRPRFQFPLVIDDLLAPAIQGQLHCMGRELMSYYRLGKNRPCSGILSRYSRLALRLHAEATIPTMTAPMMAVLVFQLLGCAYQPPAGDQTCFGYLGALELRIRAIDRRFLRDLASASHCEYACAWMWCSELYAMR